MSQHVWFCSGLSSCFDATAAGSYNIGENNVYCETSDGGGWALAMQFSDTGSSFVFSSSYIIWYGFKKTIGVRVSMEEEIGGSDMWETGSKAYPEFMKGHGE